MSEALEEKKKPEAPGFDSSRPSRNANPSIMSAPAEKSKLPLTFLFGVGCAVFAGLSVFLLILNISKSAKISQLQSDVDGYRSDIVDLKNQINELDHN